METQRMKKVLDMIASDMENDASKLDGMPFNGRNVATQFGCNMAAIKSLASMLKVIIEEMEEGR